MIPAMRDWQRFLDEVSWFLTPASPQALETASPGREALLRSSHS